MSSATLDLSDVFTPVTRSSTLGMSQDERATAANVQVLCLISKSPFLRLSSMWGSRSSQASPIKSLILVVVESVNVACRMESGAACVLVLVVSGHLVHLALVLADLLLAGFTASRFRFLASCHMIAMSGVASVQAMLAGAGGVTACMKPDVILFVLAVADVVDNGV